MNLSCSRADALAGKSSEVVRDTLGSLPPADRCADFPSACRSQSLKFAEIFPTIFLAVSQLWVPGCLSASCLPTLLVRDIVPLRAGSGERVEVLQSVLLGSLLEPGVAVLLGSQHLKAVVGGLQT